MTFGFADERYPSVTSIVLYTSIAYYSSVPTTCWKWVMSDVRKILTVSLGSDYYFLRRGLMLCTFMVSFLALG